MNEQEAIETILYASAFNREDSPLTQALDMAIKSLEKQIPKKSFFGTVHSDTAYYCSSCKNFIGFYDTRIFAYCHNCGQKLDWSEEE